MFGAILGDIIGSAYEFDANNCKSKDFPLFSRKSTFTDDTVMTLAVADALMKVSSEDNDDVIRTELVRSMQSIGRKYPYCGYGGRFSRWMFSDRPLPYNSYGNGSGMRVSFVGWFYNDLETVLRIAKLTADVSHNHPEGIKGAQAVASAVFLARTGSSKEDIKSFITEQFGYDLDRTCDEIRPTYHHVESCQGSVPEAIIAFLEGTDFEDVIRTAVSIGGDSDTIADMAGAVAEAFFGVPEELKQECRNRLPSELREILERAAPLLSSLHPTPIGIGNQLPLSENIASSHDDILKDLLAGVDYRRVLMKYNVGVYNYQDYIELYSLHEICDLIDKPSLEESFLCLTILWRNDYWSGGTEDYSAQVQYYVNQIVELMRRSN